MFLNSGQVSSPYVKSPSEVSSLRGKSKPALNPCEKQINVKIQIVRGKIVFFLYKGHDQVKFHIFFWQVKVVFQFLKGQLYFKPLVFNRKDHVKFQVNQISSVLPYVEVTSQVIKGQLHQISGLSHQDQVKFNVFEWQVQVKSQVFQFKSKAALNSLRVR